MLVQPWCLLSKWAWFANTNSRYDFPALVRMVLYGYLLESVFSAGSVQIRVLRESWWYPNRDSSVIRTEWVLPTSIFILRLLTAGAWSGLCTCCIAVRLGSFLVENWRKRSCPRVVARFSQYDAMLHSSNTITWSLREMVFWLSFRVSVTMCWIAPASNMPTASYHFFSASISTFVRRITRSVKVKKPTTGNTCEWFDKSLFTWAKLSLLNSNQTLRCTWIWYYNFYL